MLLRYCIPRVRSRGYGLGNELVPWARAFLAAQVLDAKLLPPAFGLNRRAYWQHFRTAPDDWIYNRAIEYALPRVEFSESDYLEHGAGDVVTALRSFAAARRLHDRTMFALVTDGLWGGYHHVEAAREFIRATLYRSRYAARNLLTLRDRIDPQKILVGMHIRRGDFSAPASPGEYRRGSNASPPIEWFRNIAAALQRAFGREWQLLLVSDGGPEQLQDLVDAFPCIVTADLPQGDCSDVLALSSADLVVCSASTYSSLAAFLSDSPYLWFAPNLQAHPEGCYSIHGYAGEQERQGSAARLDVQRFSSRPSAMFTRGTAVNIDGKIPPTLLDSVMRRRDLRQWQSDLVRQGVAPIA